MTGLFGEGIPSATSDGIAGMVQRPLRPLRLKPFDSAYLVAPKRAIRPLHGIETTTRKNLQFEWGARNGPEGETDPSTV